MKKALLILLLFILSGSIETSAVIRPSHIDPVNDHLVIKNMVNFTYNYASFQLSINASYDMLSNYTLVSGTWNMPGNGLTKISGVTMPRKGSALVGASIALWYPGSLPSNATPANLVAFVQYGAAGHDYESVAVAAGLWTAGQFVNVPFPISFTGGISDYGLQFYQTATSVATTDLQNVNFQVLPNPVRNEAKLQVPSGFNKNQTPVQLVVYSERGEAIRNTINYGEYLIDCSRLEDGIYIVELTDDESNTLTTKLVKAGK